MHKINDKRRNIGYSCFWEERTPPVPLIIPVGCFSYGGKTLPLFVFLFILGNIRQSDMLTMPPATPSAMESSPQGPSASSTDLPHVLVVEDNPDTLLLIRHMLKNRYRVTTLEDGNAFLEVLEAANPDLVLLDINLGIDRSGIDLLILLRRNTRWAELPVVAITAYTMYGDRERFLNYGFTDYFQKPFTQKALLEKMEELV